MRIDPVKNRTPGNEDVAAHVKYVFEEVVPKMVNPSSKLDVIGVGDGASEMVAYLQTEWARWEERVQAIAVGTGYVWANGEIHGGEFAKFWRKVSFLPPFPQDSVSFVPSFIWNVDSPVPKILEEELIGFSRVARTRLSPLPPPGRNPAYGP